jgi:hypothetical protein
MYLLVKIEFIHHQIYFKIDQFYNPKQICAPFQAKKAVHSNKRHKRRAENECTAFFVLILSWKILSPLTGEQMTAVDSSPM